MDKIKLKNCPFCGGEANFRYWTINKGVKICVECPNCGIATELYYNAKKAAGIWNRRVN